VSALSAAADGATVRAGRVLARRTFSDSRVRTLSFASLFLLIAYIQPVSYRHAYPTPASREVIAHSLGTNQAVVLFYGKAYDLLTVAGYSAWRVGGTLAIFAGVFGLLAAVRAMRTEEDAGRAELVLAGIVSRRSRFLATLAAIAAGVVLLWAMELAGLVIGGLPFASSAYLALATASVIPVFAGIGAIASQLAPTRRVALELGGAAFALAFLLRVIADTSSGAGWLRWLTPLGWAEEMRPFTGAQPAVLLLPIAAAVLLLIVAERLDTGRDTGTGILAARDAAAPRFHLLSSPTAQALRSETIGLLVWIVSTGAFAFIIGVISKAINSKLISPGLEKQLAKFGSGSVATPTGYLGFVFIFFVLVVALFAVSQMAAARHEEADEPLETLLALPVGRVQWLSGRLVLAAAGVATLAAVSAVMAWAGASIEGISISLPRMLEAGLNGVTVGVLFLGVAAFAFALLPRASAGISYGLVTVAFLWQLFGELLGAPDWLVKLTPFAHLGLVPAQPFRVVAALVMVAIGVSLCAAALVVFDRRDLIGA
jgi:ABC-2 type transport system permease protein